MVVKYLFDSNYVFPSDVTFYSFLVVDTDILIFLCFPPLEETYADEEVVCNFTKKD